MDEEKFDLVVIGGGSGGLAAARRAASYGARVALIEGAQLGGTCVNRGCVPKKAFFNAAGIALSLQDAKDYGFSLRTEGFDWAEFVARRDAYIARLHEIYLRNLQLDGVTLVHGWARLVGRREVLVRGVPPEQEKERRLSTTYLLIATGGAPEVPEVPGAELGIQSDDFFRLLEQPKRVAIVGAGYVAVEFAGVFQALGSHVELFCRGERPLRGFDAALGDKLQREMQEQGIVFRPLFSVSRLEERGGQKYVLGHTSLDQSGSPNVVATEEIHGPFDCIIWAIGRKPRLAQLGLEAEALAIEPDGRLAVDDFERTSQPNIFAIGDVTKKVELTPVAIAAGRRLADRLYGGQADARLDYDNIPTVIFSHPPVATVGMSEEQARARLGDAVKTYSTSFVDSYHSITDKKPRTFMKLVVSGPDEKIVGIHLIGRSVDEIIQGFAVALKMGAKKSDLDATVAIHPTAAEELVTLR